MSTEKQTSPSLRWYYRLSVLFIFAALILATLLATKFQLSLYQLIFIDVLITVILAFFLLGLYRRIHQPLLEMNRQAENISKGEFDEHLPEYELGEVHALASTMNQMGDRLKTLEKVRSDFVANVSHELKTPVTSIKGFVETLLEGAEENSVERRHFLEIIGKQSDRLSAIIEDLLTLARLEMEGADKQLMLQEVSANDFVNSVLDICRDHADRKQIVLCGECSENIAIDIDRSLMEQTVVNLVDNAIKYSDSGKKVFVTAERLNDRVYLHVADEGPGIEEKHLSRLFERFYRVDKARSRKLGGTGLGLAIVKHVVGAHHGSVSVSSTVGEGSVFSIELPVH